MPLLLSFVCIAALAVDGDTLRCRDIGLVRLARIDTPELRGCPRRRDCAPGDAKGARDNLARMIAGRTVRCTEVDADPRRRGYQARDRFGRPVARCSSGGRDLGEAQLRAGYAVRWP